MIHIFPADAELNLNTRSSRLTCRRLVLLALAISLNACAGSFLWGAEERATPVAYQLYLSREDSGQVEFEQYKSVPSGVFVECGSRVQGRAQAKEQGIATLSVEQEALIQEKVQELTDESGGDTVFTFDPPSGPNQVLLSLKVDARVLEIHTSLDSLVSSEGDSAAALKGLLEVLRGVPPRPLCEHDVFAQIPRQTL